MNKGKFIISLDFELYWGAAEKWDVLSKKIYFDNTRKGIPLVLNLFKKYDIHATWATVGFLFAKDKKQLREFSPKNKPSYENKSLSYYKLIDQDKIGFNENDSPYHYASTLIQKIIDTPNQELASHTFSHFYCNEKGQTIKQFEEDLISAQNLAKENFNLKLESLVFPRNQFNSKYLSVAQKAGIKVVRSNPDVWFWQNKSKVIPITRAIDTLIPISKSLSFDENSLKRREVLLLPASRFLRPFSENEKLLQGLKKRRIKKEMHHAAKNNKVYHLWWHPHNFGHSLKENLKYLEEILKYYNTLNKEFGFESKTMLELY